MNLCPYACDTQYETQCLHHGGICPYKSKEDCDIIMKEEYEEGRSSGLTRDEAREFERV